MFFSAKKIILFSLALAAFFGYNVFAFFAGDENLDFSAVKIVGLNDNGLQFETKTSAATVGAFLAENKINLSEHDRLIPDRDAALFPGTNISIERALRVQIEADGQKKEFHILSKTVAGAIQDSRTSLGEDDLIKPRLETLLKNNLIITITRVDIREETVEKPVDFETIAKEDDKLGWRTKKVQQKGAKGTKEIKYKVVSHDSKEISRKIMEQKITKEPQPEIIIQGTYVKIGKTHTGLGTWYAWKGGLFAASPWLPMGSFAKVTNKENGKSVIVQINDRGPFGPNRIIDLDKVAFAKIASIGAGVIDVKVEEVLN
jgi:hypothetical protein